MIVKHLPKILLYYLVLVVAIVATLLAIEGLTTYRFDAQLGLAIVMWGIIDFVGLLAVLLMGMLFKSILKKLKI